MSYRISEAMRTELKEPLGRLISNSEINGAFLNGLRRKRLITVGDRTTEVIAGAGLGIVMEIVDGLERRISRAPPDSGYHRLVRVKNPPGEITAEALLLIKKSLASAEKIRIYVDGEEDLLTLPSIYYADMGEMVLYGQPGQGMVIVEVDENSKKKAAKMMAEMGIPI